MTDAQNKTARNRLVLGISNVGVWVCFSALVLVLHPMPEAPPVSRNMLLKLAFGMAGIQCLLDWIGGAVLMPDPGRAGAGFFIAWLRGLFVHSLLMGAVGSLGYWSFRVTGGFLMSVAFASAGLFLFRSWIFRAVSGARIDPAEDAGLSFGSVDASDPSFTGGDCVSELKPGPLLPAAWRKQMASAVFQTAVFRRRWQMENYAAFRAFLLVLLWNLAGCWLGDTLLTIHVRAWDTALLLHSSWMTIWGFLSLLTLPSLSRSTVFGADRAAKDAGLDIRSWIQGFPLMTGEDGNPNAFWQRIFYPIPSARERLLALDLPAPHRIFGSVARTNLFLSLATLTILGRCVHCNVGRPELWVFPPVD